MAGGTEGTEGSTAGAGGSAASPERARLTAALRELKTRTGLSLAGLEDRTPYSKSSWERYLNGKTLPPRQAVRALCRLAGEPEGRPLALWEIAEAEWSGRAGEVATPATATASATATATASATASAQGDGPRAGSRGAAVAVIVAVVCAVALGCVALVLFLLPGGEEAPGAVTASPSSPTDPRCRGAECEGQDPMHMGCGRAPDTLASYRTATGARMELRYSAACGAGWARVWDARVGDRIEVTAGGGRALAAEVLDEVDAQNYVYTAMAEARPGMVVRACFRPGQAGERECFDERVG